MVKPIKDEFVHEGVKYKVIILPSSDNKFQLEIDAFVPATTTYWSTKAQKHGFRAEHIYDYEFQFTARGTEDDILKLLYEFEKMIEEYLEQYETAREILMAYSDLKEV